MFTLCNHFFCLRNLTEQFKEIFKIFKFNSVELLGGDVPVRIIYFSQRENMNANDSTLEKLAHH